MPKGFSEKVIHASRSTTHTRIGESTASVITVMHTVVHSYIHWQQKRPFRGTGLKVWLSAPVAVVNVHRTSHVSDTLEVDP